MMEAAALKNINLQKDETSVFVYVRKLRFLFYCAIKIL